MTTRLRNAYLWHRAHSVSWVGHFAEQALSLARAELWARDAGIKPRWEWDENPDLSWCDCKGCTDARAKHGAGAHGEHEVTGCILEMGAYHASVWGVVDADRNYRRTIEAELACELVAEVNRDLAPYRVA